jgi:hypothetical protein
MGEKFSRRTALGVLVSAAGLLPGVLVAAENDLPPVPPQSGGKAVYVIRDVFRAKPGKSRQLAEMFKKTLTSLEGEDGFSNPRVMLDFVTEYWTVVLESETDSLEKFEKHMATYAARPEVREALAGYMDLVQEGHREIYRLV